MFEEIDDIVTERTTRTVSGMPYQRCYLTACSKEVNNFAAEVYSNSGRISGVQ